MKEKLKIGILLNNTFIAAWEFQILKDILDSASAEIVVIVRNKSDHPHVEKKENQLAPTLLKLLDKTDEIVFSGKGDYNQKKDVSGLLRNIPELDLNGGNRHSQDDLLQEAINDLTKYNLDIIIKFGFHILNKDILKTAKYGVWTNSLDDQNVRSVLKTGFWEVVKRQPVTNSVLEVFKDSIDKKEIVFNCWESTCPFSININRNNIFWRTSLFMPRTINGLYRNGEGFLNRQKNKYKSLSLPEDFYFQPLSFLAVSKYILNYIGVAAKTIYKKLLYSDAFTWQVLFEINKERNSLSPDFHRFKKLVSPKGIFWADPFVIAKNDNYFVFVEEFIYKKNKAHISVLKLDNNGNLLSSDRIIERDYHMSYPFIFSLENVYYMIPETGKNKTIELYKCTDFPYKWEFERNIMGNLSAVDTTLFFYNNKWWLFTSLDQTRNNSGSSTELFLYYTDDFFSDKWESHPDNPIVSDVRTARPAGKLFIHEDKIYRPSQNCSGRYGKAFNLSHVTKLTANEYSETLISEIEPVWNKKLKGTHTYNSDKDFTVIDVYSYRKRINGR